jgi:quercetin dioxygenase-like cupin family protein
MISWQALEDPVPGVQAAAAAGAHLSAARYTLSAGALVPLHSHPNEEFGVVLRGSLELRHGHRSEILQAGDAFLLAGGDEHGARAGADGCELVECYAPPR